MSIQLSKQPSLQAFSHQTCSHFLSHVPLAIARGLSPLHSQFAAAAPRLLPKSNVTNQHHMEKFYATLQCPPGVLFKMARESTLSRSLGLAQCITRVTKTGSILPIGMSEELGKILAGKAGTRQVSCLTNAPCGTAFNHTLLPFNHQRKTLLWLMNGQLFLVLKTVPTPTSSTLPSATQAQETRRSMLRGITQDTQSLVSRPLCCRNICYLRIQQRTTLQTERPICPAIEGLITRITIFRSCTTQHSTANLMYSSRTSH